MGENVWKYGIGRWAWIIAAVYNTQGFPSWCLCAQLGQHCSLTGHERAETRTCCTNWYIPRLCLFFLSYASALDSYHNSTRFLKTSTKQISIFKMQTRRIAGLYYHDYLWLEPIGFCIVCDEYIYCIPNPKNHTHKYTKVKVPPTQDKHTQLSGRAELPCYPIKSLADPNQPEYVDTHSLPTSCLCPCKLDICMGTIGSYLHVAVKSR